MSNESAPSRSWSQPPVIIVGIDRDPGLQAARILHARGVPLVGIAIDPSHFGCRTRVCEEILFADGYDDIVRLLEEIGPSFADRPVLIPCSDPTVLRLAQARSRLEPWYRIPLPPAETVELLMDKTAFYEYAQSQGMAIPPTRVLRSRDDVLAAAEELAFPCAFKPPYRTAEWVAHTHEKAMKVSSPSELVELYDQCRDWAFPLIAQEWIEGGDTDLFSCNCYFDAHGAVLVTFIARKLRQWPVEAGDSSLGQECRNDEVLHESIRLFESVGYHGLGYVEMKRDARTGRHYIIEPNVGRPTGRSAIAEAGGVELLYTMYCDLVGWPLPEARAQTYGDAKWIYLRKDLQAAFRQWRAGTLTWAAWRASMRGPKFYAIWSAKDPLPFLFDIWNTAKKVVAERRR